MYMVRRERENHRGRDGEGEREGEGGRKIMVRKVERKEEGRK